LYLKPSQVVKQGAGTVENARKTDINDGSMIMSTKQHWKTVERQLALGFGMALLVAMVIGAATYTETVRGLRLSAAALHTRETIQELSETLVTLQDAETGQRGFLLTGDGRYRKPSYGLDCVVIRASS